MQFDVLCSCVLVFTPSVNTGTCGEESRLDGYAVRAGTATLLDYLSKNGMKESEVVTQKPAVMLSDFTAFANSIMINREISKALEIHIALSGKHSQAKCIAVCG